MNRKAIMTNFTKKGFEFRQLKRLGDLAIYERSSKSVRLPHYEVIMIGGHDGYKHPSAKDANGESLFFEPAETYPSSEMWGSKGWTFNSLSAAEKKFEELSDNK